MERPFRDVKSLTLLKESSLETIIGLERLKCVYTLMKTRVLVI